MKLLFAFLTYFTTAVVMAQPAGTQVLVPARNITSTSTLSRGPDPSVRYQRVMCVYTPAEVQGIGNGLSLVSLGFRLRTPATAPATGTLRLWLRNAQDTNYLLTDQWAYSIQNPVAFQQVFNGPLTIPAVAGFFDVTFTVPFTYTGGGLYLAFEWENPNTLVASGAYDCDAGLAQSLRADTSPTALPAILSQFTAFRPQLRLGYLTPGRDAAVAQVYGPGKLPKQASISPFPVQALVTNLGSQPLTNLPVTFTPGSGTAGGLPYTVNLPALAVGASRLVRLPALTAAPNAAPTTFARYTVSVPADQNAANDHRTDSAYVSLQDLTYVTGFPNNATGIDGAGFNSGRGSGTLLCRFPLRAPTLVTSIQLRTWPYTTNPGQTVFAVLLNEQGTLVARSADVVLNASSATTSTWLTCPLPQPTQVSGRAFYAGLAQTAPTQAGRYYYPLAYQPETPVRDSAYYSAVGDLALTGQILPQEFRLLGRFAVEVSLVSAPLAARPAGMPVTAVDVWPNPIRQHDAVHIRLPTGLALPATAELLDASGRVLFIKQGLNSLPADCLWPLTKLPTGLYILRLYGPGWHTSRQLTIEN